MLETGIRSGAYGLSEADTMLAHGFTAINFCDFASKTSSYYTMSEEARHARLTDVRRSWEAAGLRFNQTHAPCPTDDETPESRAKMTEMILVALRGSAVLGASDMVLHARMPHGYTADPDPEESYAMNVELMRTILPVAHEVGVRIAMENLPYAHLPMAHMPMIRRLVDEIDDPYFGICLDTGHATVTGHGAPEMARLAGEKLFALHVHDNNLKQDLHLLPFTGRMDFGEFRCALRDIGFSGVVSIETSVRREVPEELYNDLRAFVGKAAQWIADVEA